MNHYTVHWRSELPKGFPDVRALRAEFGLVLDDEEVAQALGAPLTDKPLRELIRGAAERYVNRKLDRETDPTAEELNQAATRLEHHARELAARVGAERQTAAEAARREARAKGNTEEQKAARAAAREVAAAEEAMKAAVVLGWRRGTSLVDKDMLALQLRVPTDAAAKVPGELNSGTRRGRRSAGRAASLGAGRSGRSSRAAKAWFETDEAERRAFEPGSGLMVLRNLSIRIEEEGVDPTPR